MDAKEVRQMVGSEITWNSYWWIVPLFMMVLCFFMMRGWRRFGMCGFGPRDIDRHQTQRSESALEILDKRYASGEISKEEYQERKKVLTETMAHQSQPEE